MLVTGIAIGITLCWIVIIYESLYPVVFTYGIIHLTTGFSIGFILREYINVKPKFLDAIFGVGVVCASITLLSFFVPQNFVLAHVLAGFYLGWCLNSILLKNRSSSNSTN